jgi:ornithine cyclodeaminase
MLVLAEADVERLIEVKDAIAAAGDAYRLHATGAVPPPVRADLRSEVPKVGCLVLAGLLGPDLLTVKSNVHAHPNGPEGPRLWGSLLTLWDLTTGKPRALISARAFNNHRTAAGFAAAARVLADPNATTLALFGAGKSAPMTALYLKAARPSIRRLVLVGRSPRRVAALAAWARACPHLSDVLVETGSSPGDAVREAEIVATVTTSDEAVFPGASVRAGALVILGGANRPAAREADDDLMGRARVIVDARAGALDKAGDLVRSLASGALDPVRIVAEIGACLDGSVPEAAGTDVTVFKSMGLPVQDAVLAAHLVRKAERAGLGRPVDLEGAR